MLAAQVLSILDIEEHEDREDDGEKVREPCADGRLREGVDRRDDAAAGQERSPDREPERSKD